MVVVVVLVVYVMSSLTYGRTLRSTAVPTGFHAVTAEAILDGHVAIASAPLGLVELPDPQDPAANVEYRQDGLHDFAYFEGRIYSAMGPTPAVLLHIPYRLLGLGYLNPNLATLVSIAVGFLAMVAALGELRRRFFQTLSLPFEAICITAMGLGTPLPWIISIGRAYETAIACGFMLTAIGTWALLRALRAGRERPSFWLLSVAGAALALAVGSRPHLAVAVILVALAIAAIVRNDRFSISTKRFAVVSLSAPYAAVGVLLGAYNFARFHSFTDFGTRHQMAGVNTRTYPMFQLRNLVPNVNDYFLLWPRLESRWPYVHLSTMSDVTNPAIHGREPVAGLVWLFPTVIIGVGLAAVCFRRLFGKERNLAWMICGYSLMLILIIVSVSISFNSSTMRYSVDFVPLMSLLAVVMWCWARVHERAWSMPLLTATLATSATISVVMGVALVLTRCPGTGSC